MNILKHLWHFLATTQYRDAALFSFVIGFEHWAQRRVILARHCSKVLRQNIVNANGYSGLMVPNLHSLEMLCDDSLWNGIAFNYFVERDRLRDIEKCVKAGKIVIVPPFSDII